MSKTILTAVITLLIAWPWMMIFSDRPSSEALAMSTHGTDDKTMATVPLDGGMEAVVTLDHTTGDMVGYVLDRFSGKFFLQYQYNVLQDFPDANGKFLVVAGLADFRQFTGNERLASGVLYVSEETSGQVVAYGIPWNTQFRASNVVPQQRTFVRLDFGRTRFTQLR